MKFVKAKLLKALISNHDEAVKAKRVPCIEFSAKDGSLAYLVGAGEKEQFGLINKKVGRAFIAPEE